VDQQYPPEEAKLIQIINDEVQEISQNYESPLKEKASEINLKKIVNQKQQSTTKFM
jgi:hypothetical protein